MKKERKDNSFIKKPVYKGGPKAISQFIKKNIRYPKNALEAKLEGTVVLKYTINHLGKVIEAKVISGIGHGCDEEAVRLVKLLKFEVPKTRGVRVTFHKDIKIHFRLPKTPVKKVEIPTPTPQQVQYNYVVTPVKKAAPKTSDKSKKTSKTYTIQVNIK